MEALRKERDELSAKLASEKSAVAAGEAKLKQDLERISKEREELSDKLKVEHSTAAELGAIEHPAPGARGAYGEAGFGTVHGIRNEVSPR
jgi:hypothetical protein